MRKRSRVRTLMESEHVKGSERLFKYELENFYLIF